ncbi:oligosaccharide flippase family protein [Kamptonema formosum]|uniref:oligosaccharide flippase family protein n=1 Tax=Kamptonema formosum TaxID=331992 RepID=UPI001E2A89F2|nr:oligosaccharide flippase family protein [Oscillatoria sp. PCC 10802]
MIMGRRKVVGNSLSMAVNRLAQSLTSFVLFAWIARLLGPYELGQYLLAFTYYFIFMSVAAQGFKTLFTRELSRHPQETPVYLVSGTLLQLLFSLTGYALLFAAVFALPYSSDTSTVCYVLGLAILPFSLSNVTEAIFQAQEKMHLIAASTVPVYILRVGVMVWAMKLNFGVSFLAGIFVISEFLILLIEWVLLARTVKPKWQINWEFIWHTVRAARTLVAIEGVAALSGRMQVLILSLLGGEVVVGLFGGVAQLMQPFEILAQSVVLAVFPSLSKAVTLGKEKQRHLVESIAEILLCVALPLLVGLYFMGGDLLIFIYRDPSFAEATAALKVVALGLVAVSFIRPLSSLLVANGLERVNLREVSVTNVLGGLFSVVLVSQYQLLGAAIAALLMNISACSQYMYAVRTRLFSIHWWGILRRPLLISVFMLAVFLILQEISQNFLLTAVAASLAYLLLMGVLGFSAVGRAAISRNQVS